MATLVADRVDRPPTLFDFVEGTPAVPAKNPEHDAERERAAGRTPAPAQESAPAQDRARAAELDTPAAAREPEPATGAAAGAAVRGRGGVGGEPTLDDLVVDVWEGLTAQAAVACPVCEGTLRPRYAGGGSADPVVAGCCDRCGTTLS